jgi:glycine/serine hydroxymethyltransferase
MSVQSNSKHYEAYYKQVLKGKRAKDESLAKVFDIITDLTDRRGLRQEWEEIDGDIQDEIIEKWKEIINKNE